MGAGGATPTPYCGGCVDTDAGRETDWTDEELGLRRRVEAGEAVVANVSRWRSHHRRLVAWAKAAGMFSPVDRTTALGNPFVLGRDGDRDEVCDKYAAHLAARPDLLEQARALRGRVLGCHCAPLRCHADTVAAVANGAPCLPPRAAGSMPRH